MRKGQVGIPRICLTRSTPMNAMLGMADLLARTPLSEDQRRFVELMRVNGDALLDLINDILDLAKIESGRLTIESASFDLVGVDRKSRRGDGNSGTRERTRTRRLFRPGRPHRTSSAIRCVCARSSSTCWAMRSSSPRRVRCR